MHASTPFPVSRRDFLRTSGRVAGASVLAGVALPHVHAASSDLIQVALVGCGGRGTGAAGQALSTQSGPIKLVAMADAFPARLAASAERLAKSHLAQFDVPPERRFVGLDSYKAAMDALKPGDIVILATPPAFRWVHFSYALSKKLHVFMEKPVTVDGPTSRRMLQLGEEAARLNLKVGVGLMCRHCRARGELYQRIRDGEAGELLLLRAYRMHGPIGFFASPPKPEGISHLMYQVQRFHSFLWSGGGAFSDFYIHNIDECCWMKDAWPVLARGNGARHFRGDSVDQNFDAYSVEYVFADGARLFLEGRCMKGAAVDHSSHAHGTKGLAVISAKGHAPSRAAIYRGHNPDPAAAVWAAAQPEPSPYQMEWDDLVGAIRADRPFNEVRRGVEASLVTSMGRFAAHTGQPVTFDQMLNHEHEFAPGLDALGEDSPAPLQPGPDGRYPVPEPGVKTAREYRIVGYAEPRPRRYS